MILCQVKCSIESSSPLAALLHAAQIDDASLSDRLSVDDLDSVRAANRGLFRWGRATIRLPQSLVSV